MSVSIFFSWQADTPTKEGRNLLERALERAVGRLGTDASLEPAVRDGIELDRDTKGVSGYPPIVDTIFKKIDNAAVFIPDLTFIGTRIDGRPTPNPNVLIEYGWALKSLSHARIVPVMNIAHGTPVGDAMPFDMRHLRHPLQYNLHSDATEDVRRDVKDRLARDLESAIRGVLTSEEYQSSLTVVRAIPPFPEAEPMDGPARFRAPGQALGFNNRFRSTPSKIFLQPGPSVWLRLIPTTAVDRRWTAEELREIATNGFLIQKIGEWSNGGFLHAGDGFGYFATDDNETVTSSLTFIFETGEIWSIDTWAIQRTLEYKVDGRFGVPYLEAEMTDALTNFSSLLLRLGFSKPYRWIAGYHGLVDSGLHYPEPPGQHLMEQGPKGLFQDDVVTLSGVLGVDDPATLALKPFFRLLFQRCGKTRPDYLDRHPKL